MMSTKRARILLMEKDRGVALLLKNNLERTGYYVDVVHTGEESMDYIGTGAYHLLCIDHTMSDMTGFEVVRTLSMRDELPPTIMIIGTDCVHIAVEAVAPEVDEYIVKNKDGLFYKQVPSIVKYLPVNRTI